MSGSAGSPDKGAGKNGTSDVDKKVDAVDDLDEDSEFDDDALEGDEDDLLDDEDDDDLIDLDDEYDDVDDDDDRPTPGRKFQE